MTLHIFYFLPSLLKAIPITRDTNEKNIQILIIIIPKLFINTSMSSSGLSASSICLVIGCLFPVYQYLHIAIHSDMVQYHFTASRKFKTNT